jgi:hypothetical protein
MQSTANSFANALPCPKEYVEGLTFCRRTTSQYHCPQKLDPQTDSRVQDVLLSISYWLIFGIFAIKLESSGCQTVKYDQTVWSDELTLLPSYLFELLAEFGDVSSCCLLLSM